MPSPPALWRVGTVGVVTTRGFLNRLALRYSYLNTSLIRPESEIMDCPTCKKELQPETYESVPLFQCPQCSGYLVKSDRLLLIRGKRGESMDELRQEAESQAAADTSERIHCPRCRATKMTKETLERGDDEFSIDRCEKCDLVWLDGGELARLQIEFETSAVAINQFVHQRRLASRDSQQRAEFDKQLSSNRPRTMLSKLSDELMLLIMVLGSLIAGVVLFALSFKYWSLFASLSFFGGIAMMVLREADNARVRFASIVALTAMQIAYLIFIVFFA